jgi:acyl carrier protein
MNNEIARQKAIFERVRSVIAAQLYVDLDHVTADAALKGNLLKADSLDLVNLILALAIEFGIEMRDDEVPKIITVGDLVNYLEVQKMAAERYIPAGEQT